MGAKTRRAGQQREVLSDVTGFTPVTALSGLREAASDIQPSLAAPGRRRIRLQSSAKAPRHRHFITLGHFITLASAIGVLINTIAAIIHVTLWADLYAGKFVQASIGTALARGSTVRYWHAAMTMGHMIANAHASETLSVSTVSSASIPSSVRFTAELMAIYQRKLTRRPPSTQRPAPLKTRHTAR